MVALFRIETPAQGTVEIDGVDVSTIPLAALRSSLGLIPQEPVMFSSSLRFNIDPFSKHTDEELWDVLGSVGLKPTVEELKLGLEETVEEGGENFSMGQRQLICFARALLRSPKIVLLDEATASVDNETDTLIQRMIRERFADKTVLTIAHRLNTILDSDRVLCLDDGALVEYDNPNTLLEKDGGAFRGMWDKAQQARHATH
jgi:ABC-type multidrug transport system fused ATPase/permease subunit